MDGIVNFVAKRRSDVMRIKRVLALVLVFSLFMCQTVYAQEYESGAKGISAVESANAKIEENFATVTVSSQEYYSEAFEVLNKCT